MFQFRQAKQLQGETVDQYATRLRKLAANCDFSNVDNEATIQNCTSERLRRYALREDALKLDNLLSKARAFEVSEHQEQGIEESLDSSSGVTIKHEKPNFVRARRYIQPSKSNPRTAKSFPSASSICGNCGFRLPHKGPCPARGKSCNAFGKANHFAKVCRSQNELQF
ncbi:uncharacterized protein LOC135694831 [Rhopilema esculentum]|uniref:uncharacterized protein LOC135694831 n=1 Tax=Rhopilema esculentum TaxID=499914 RepID=UPI0031DCE74E